MSKFFSSFLNPKIDLNLIFRFLHIEHELNEREDAVPIKNIMADLFMLLRENVNFESSCLQTYCENPDTTSLGGRACKDLDLFKAFLTASGGFPSHDFFMSLAIQDFAAHKLAAQESARFDEKMPLYGKNSAYTPPVGNRSAYCQHVIKDFHFMDTVVTNFGSDYNKDVVLQPGTLMKWLYYHLPTEDDRYELYEKFLNGKEFAYGDEIGLFDISIPDITKILFKSDKKRQKSENWDLNMNDKIRRIMEHSTNPPLLFPEYDKSTKIGTASKTTNALFPFCIYNNDKGREGVDAGPYKESYCHSFQPVMNDRGQCYSYNNLKIHSDEGANGEAIKVRQVAGCGKRKGMRLVIDTHNMHNMVPSQWKTREGFIIYVTVNGVITHKVPFVVYPRDFHGEYNIYLHGLHFITGSDAVIQFIQGNPVSH